MGGEDRTSHDRNFKNLILDYPGPALELFAAEEAAGRLEGDRYAALSEEESVRYREEYLASSPRKEEIMGMFLKAAEEGRKEGRKEGVQQGEALILERLMRKRFGDLSPQVEERLARARKEELELWADRVLDARTLEEVFGE